MFRRWEKIFLWLLIALYVLTLFMSPVLADTVTVTWTNAVSNTDGSPIPTDGDSALEVTVISYSLCEEGGLKPERTTVEVPIGATGYQTEITKSGEYCFAAYHRNVGGTWSALSEVKSVIVSPPKVIDTRAYSVAKINNAFFLIVIGEVPLDTPCIESETVNGKYVVPNDAVIFSGTNDAGTVVADCG